MPSVYPQITQNARTICLTFHEMQITMIGRVTGQSFKIIVAKNGKLENHTKSLNKFRSTKKDKLENQYSHHRPEALYFQKQLITGSVILWHEIYIIKMNTAYNCQILKRRIQANKRQIGNSYSHHRPEALYFQKQLIPGSVIPWHKIYIIKISKTNNCQIFERRI